MHFSIILVSGAQTAFLAVCVYSSKAIGDIHNISLHQKAKKKIYQ